MITRDADADTFAKLLARNAARFADRAAMRHKVFGIWKTWTWAQLLDEVRAYAVGLHRLGLRRGDRVAIIGFVGLACPYRFVLLLRGQSVERRLALSCLI